MDNRILLASLEDKYQLPKNLLNAVMTQESGGNPNAVSPKGAKGYFQFMPDTAKAYGVNPTDFVSSATGAAKMYSDLLKTHNGDLDKALASYNWGQGNVARKGMDKLPAETSNYITKVKSNMGTDDMAEGEWKLVKPATSNEEPSGEWKMVKPASDKPINPTEGNSFGKNLLIGAGKAFVDAGRGAGQVLADSVRNDEFVNTAMPNGAKNNYGMPTSEDIKQSRKLDEPLMNTGGGITGNILGNVAMAVPTAFIPGANTYTGSAAIGSALGALQPTTENESRTKNTAIGGLSGVVAKFATDKVANSLQGLYANKKAASDLIKSQNSTIDATQREVVDAGYALPPGYANGGKLSRTVAGLSGKDKLNQAAIIKNTQKTNELAKRYLDLPNSTSLNDEVLQLQRQQLGKPYADASALPEGIVGHSSTKSLSTGKSVITPIKVNGEQLVTDIKQARFDAKAHWDSFKRTGAVENQKSAEALDETVNKLEDQLVKLAYQNGDTTLAQRLKDARMKIAKNYQVDRALNADTGNIDARVFAKMKNKGGMLTKEGATIAKFANAYGDIARLPKSGDSLPVTAVDGMLGSLIGGVGMATGGVSIPAVVAPAMARVTARQALLTPYVQQAMANKSYMPSLLSRIGNSVGSNELLRNSMPALGSLGLLAYSK